MTEYLGQLWQQWGRSILEQIPHIIQAVIVGLLTFYLSGRLQRAVERMTGVGHRRRELNRLLGRLVRIGIVFGGLLIILGIFNQTQFLASFITSLGIFGLLIAFALQDITRNFAAGVLLLLQRPFGLDDRIRVEPYEGIVTDISLRATMLRTNEGHEVLIPNAQVFGGAITNLTRYPRRRHTIVVTLPSSVDTTAAKRALENVLREAEHIEPDPAPYVAATTVGKDDYQFEARFWLRSAAPETPTVLATVTLSLQQAAQKLRGSVVGSQ